MNKSDASRPSSSPESAQHDTANMLSTGRCRRGPAAAALTTAVKLAMLASVSRVSMAMVYSDDYVTASFGDNSDEYLLRHPFDDHTEAGSWFDGAFDGDGFVDPDGVFSDVTDRVGRLSDRLQLFNGTSPCGVIPDGITADPNACNASSSDNEELQQLPGNYWALILLVFPLLTVFGNVLVVMSVYRERSLQSVTNYFIVSLAIADIMVAILVMPLAVYVEVNNGGWELGDALCDTWVALDVMCCTASILNLAAIGVDRFYAVTLPIKYAKHKNSNRVYVMLALTWVISITISSPIALGMNYTERRAQTPTLCTFYNSDFLIYSSMGSFYIPCIVMTLLYWRIFHAIRQRARKSKATAAPIKLVTDAKPPVQSASRSSARPSAAEPEVVIINRLPTSAIGSPIAAASHLYVPPPPQFTTATSETEDNCSTSPRRLLPTDRRQRHTGHNHVVDCDVITCADDADVDGGVYDGGVYDGGDVCSAPDDSSCCETRMTVNEPGSNGKTCRSSAECGGYSAPTAVVVENSTADELEIPVSGPRHQLSTSSLHAHAMMPLAVVPPADGSSGVCVGSEVYRNGGGHKDLVTCSGGTSARGGAVTVEANGARSGTKAISLGKKKFVTLKFNFKFKKPLGKKSSSDKQKQRSGAHNAQRRERKATKTLAIVLGVFLLCWVPFFTINIINAICIRYDLFDNHSVCQIDPMLFSFFVWLGYMNSFLNPVIYTIFNMEFRRAFKNILQNPCGK